VPTKDPAERGRCVLYSFGRVVFLVVGIVELMIDTDHELVKQQSG
jgi:hypothetical protein